jgi:hypothetical protein
MACLARLLELLLLGLQLFGVSFHLSAELLDSRISLAQALLQQALTASTWHCRASAAP